MSEPRRVMIAVAHPDDVEYGLGAAVAAWSAAGDEIAYVIGTRGEAGMDSPEWPPQRTGRVREEEQRHAAAILGVEQVDFLAYRDGQIENGIGPRRDLARCIRRFRPHLLVTLNFDLLLRGRRLNHSDHRAFGLAVLDAARDAAARWIFPELLTEGLEPWTRLSEVYVAATGDADVVVSVDEDCLRKAVLALQAHASYIGDLDADSFLRQRAADAGRDSHHQLAVNFRVVQI